MRSRELSFDLILDSTLVRVQANPCSFFSRRRYLVDGQRFPHTFYKATDLARVIWCPVGSLFGKRYVVGVLLSPLEENRVAEVNAALQVILRSRFLDNCFSIYVCGPAQREEPLFTAVDCLVIYSID